jgi:hypothetical protein
MTTDIVIYQGKEHTVKIIETVELGELTIAPESLQEILAGEADE